MAGLLQLEEDLSCSICLSTFDCPVTVPCGHNFCNNCLLLTWADCCSFSCPQCRAVFPTRPDLKKNTVLSTIVESFSSKMADKMEAKLSGEPTKVEKDGVILCDTCMETEASKTCLTCMASFCEEHLKPHRMNPVFSLHPLVEPVRNLFEWTCQNHHKLMEFFCSQHGQVICSLCHQQDHKGCCVISAEEQRNLKKAYFKDQLDFLDKKRVQNEKVIGEMSMLPESLQNSATSTKKALAAEYQRIRDMLTQEEQNALLAVDHEVQNGHVKIKTLMKKFTSNISTISKAKEHIQSVLKEPQTLAFLQASFDLPPAAKFDPHTPRINLDSPNVKLSKDFATSLNQFLTESFKMTPEARLGRLKTAGVAEEKSTPVPPAKAATKKNKQMKKDLSKSMENLLNMKEMLSGLHVASASKLGAGPQEALDITSVKDRHELLIYARTLTLDRTTANKRIVMSDGYTRATVADQPLNYPNCPQRFTVCSQVLGSTGFNTGRHYWEVLLSSNNFIGIGLTYQDIDRGGLSSRLGRNSVSWCIEWLNNKLSAWHDTNETVLENTHPKCVGVLLDCEGGTATFYNVAHKATPFHSFVFPFAKAVYPAFWVFPGGSSLSLRRL